MQTKKKNFRQKKLIIGLKKFAANFTRKSLAVSQKIFFLSLMLMLIISKMITKIYSAGSASSLTILCVCTFGRNVESTWSSDNPPTKCSISYCCLYLQCVLECSDSSGSWRTCNIQEPFLPHLQHPLLSPLHAGLQASVEP